MERCAWAASDSIFLAYHDQEWGVPQHDSRALWEMLMLEGFQAGSVVGDYLRKRDAFRKAFKQFDPKKIARFSERDIVRLLGDPGIIRSRAKIEATIGGARAYLAMQAAGEDFSTFIWNFTGGKPIQNQRRVPAQYPALRGIVEGAESSADLSSSVRSLCTRGCRRSESSTTTPPNCFPPEGRQPLTLAIAALRSASKRDTRSLRSWIIARSVFFART